MKHTLTAIILLLLTVKSLMGGFTPAHVYAIDYTSRYPTLDTAHVISDDYRNSTYYPHYSFDQSLSLIGNWALNMWGTNDYPHRINVDLNSGYIVRRIYYENAHDSGYDTTYSAKTFTLWGSNDSSAFSNTTYGNNINWTELVPSQYTFDQHISADTADPKYITIDNASSFRYYSIKIADTWGGSWFGFRRIELQTENGYSPTPTPTITPTPTPTPMPTPTPIINPGFPDYGKCEYYYDDIMTAAKDDGQYYWRIINKSSSTINVVDYYTSGTGGAGYYEHISGNPDVVNFGPNPTHADYSSFDFNDYTHLFATTRWVDYIICHFQDGTQSNAGVTFGKQSNPSGFPQAGASGNTCVDWTLTIPISKIDWLSFGWSDWVFHLPNFPCIIVNFFTSIFGIDTSIVSSNYTVWLATLNSKAPFAYALAVQDAIPDISSPSGVASIADIPYNFEIPKVDNGVWTYTPFLVGTFEFAPYSELQTQITQFRTAIAVLIWVAVFVYIFFRVTSL